MRFFSPTKASPAPPASGSLRGGDAIFLHLERPDNVLNVVNTLSFKNPQDLDLVMQDLLLLIEDNPPFRRIYTRGTALSAPRWIDHPGIVPEDHLHVSVVPASISMAEHTQQYVARLMEVPFPMDRPLWDLHIIQGTSADDPEADGSSHGSTVILCVHHSFGDAQAFVHTFIRLSSKSASPPRVLVEGPAVLPALETPKEKTTTPGFRDIASSFRSIADGFSSTMQHSRDLHGFTRASLHYPGERPLQKDVLLADVGTLQDLQRMRKAYPKATINDLLLTAITLSLRGLLLRHDDLKDERLAVMIPASYRCAGDTSLGNQVSFSLVFPPSDEPEAERLLEAVHEKMGIFKASWVLKMIRLGHDYFHARRSLISYDLIDGLMAKGHVTFSNVPGPREVVYFGGQPAETMYIGTSQRIKGTFYINVVTYMDGIFLTIVGDKTPEQAGYLEEIRDGFIEEIAKMKAY